MTKPSTLTADDLIGRVWASGATDLLLTPGLSPMVRVNGELTRLELFGPLTEQDTESVLGGVLDDEQVSRVRAGEEVDFSFGWRDQARIRGNAFKTSGVPALALRIIPSTIPSFGDLGTPAVVQQLADLRQGLILVTGPTGSGKSTTLASMVDHINRTRACHILTIEDPVEHVHRHQRSAVNQREVGLDTASFPAALRSALREDPDVILVGEMRDLDSIRFALTLAETGHLVLSTLHTNDTSQAVDRMVDVFPGDQQPQIRVQLAATLSGIVHQRLLPRAGGGLVAAYEVLVATPPVRNLVREGKANQLRNQIVTGQKDGMQTLEQSLSALVQSGAVTLDDAVLRSAFPRDVRA